MKKKEPLSPKEENFCRFFVASREPRASAARAGYSVHPERTAMRLLADPEIKRRIAKLENEREACGGHGGLPQARVRERCGRGEAHFVGRAALRVGARKAGFDNGIGYQMPEERWNRGQIFRSAQGTRPTLRAEQCCFGGRKFGFPLRA